MASKTILAQPRPVGSLKTLPGGGAPPAALLPPVAPRTVPPAPAAPLAAATNVTTGPASTALSRSDSRTPSQECQHLAQLLAAGDEGRRVLKRYRQIVKWAVRERLAAGKGKERANVQPPTCGSCDEVLSRPAACLGCSFVGCLSSAHGKGAHVFEHGRKLSHAFSVDSFSGAVHCADCHDFVTSAVFRKERRLIKIQEENRVVAHKQGAKRKRPAALAWEPNEAEADALSRTTSLGCRGLRGLRNIGQTCFLNVILQIFAHNPLLRDHFLADYHNPGLCTENDCTCCEMDRIFTEFNSDDRTPYGPITFLANMWQSSDHLAGYAQQDCHEFFIAALNQMHENSGGTERDCTCAIHSTFYGKLQSDVCCASCGAISSAIDPMLDISLDLRSKAGVLIEGENSLAKSLARYTSPEKLGQQYVCESCHISSFDAVKQLSIKEIPPVLTFQFKRFEHKSGDQSIKIDTPVKFPPSIDMTPYTTRAARAGGQVKPSEADEMIWDLFAVVLHRGQINNGHYTNFCRFRNDWYYFDDEKVGLSSLEIVLSCKPYILAYVKRNLEYKA